MGGVVLSTFLFCDLLCSFWEAQSHPLKKTNHLRWRGDKKNRATPVCSPANGWLHDLHFDWSVSGWESNSCFRGVSFLILRVAAWSAVPVIQLVVLFKRLN